MPNVRLGVGSILTHLMVLVSEAGSSGVMNVCLPRWAQGTVQPVEFSLVDMHPPPYPCAEPNPQNFVFDDVTIVSEPACTEGANLFDPGFEQVKLASAVAPLWKLGQYHPEDVSSTLKVDANSAHTGNVSAEFKATRPCGYADVAGPVTVPVSSAKAGPALKFWYRTNYTTGNATMHVTMEALSSPASIPSATSWTQAVICLNPAFASRQDYLAFYMLGGGGDCSVPNPSPETFSLDDIELTTDPSCSPQ
jgi:hypothetical protein